LAKEEVLGLNRYHRFSLNREALMASKSEITAKSAMSWSQITVLRSQTKKQLNSSRLRVSNSLKSDAFYTTTNDRINGKVDVLKSSNTKCRNSKANPS